MKYEHLKKIQGYEYDWLATDSTGCVAVFMTAGGAYAPKCFVENLKTYIDVFEKLNDMPIIDNSEKSISERITNGCSCTDEIARRGLFVFDAKFTLDLDSPYILDKYPTNKLDVGDLPHEIKGVVSMFVFNNLRFDSTSEITPEMILEEEMEE
ncbi:MAG: hypothetical protein AB8B80_10210 [Marinicellaceae bacterium]